MFRDQHEDHTRVQQSTPPHKKPHHESLSTAGVGPYEGDILALHDAYIIMTALSLEATGCGTPGKSYSKQVFAPLRGNAHTHTGVFASPPYAVFQGERVACQAGVCATAWASLLRQGVRSMATPSEHEALHLPAPPDPDGGASQAAPLPLRRWITQGFSRAEDAVYIGLGVLLAVNAMALLLTGVLHFWEGLRAGTLARDIVVQLDRMLLILMIVEILYTVQVSFREHVLTAEPFLIVGLIAATRRILVLTATFTEMLSLGETAFRNAMLEMGVLTVLILALVVSLFLLRKPHVGSSIARE
jgi:uncharacterized membrane protein (DUF373 family)